MYIIRKGLEISIFPNILPLFLSPMVICQQLLLVVINNRKGGSGWGLVLSVIWPVILMFSVKICKILMFSVLKKLTVKCSKVLEQ